MNEEKTFLQKLYEAIFQAEDLQPENNPGPTTDPPMGSEEASFTSSNPPPGGEAKNRVLDGLTYIDSPRGCSPQNPPKPRVVGGPTLPPAKPPVGDVCQAVQDGPRKLLELLQEIALGILPPGNRELHRKVGTVVFMVPLELLALHLGVSRQTVWTWRKELEATGLVASDVLYTKVDGQQRALGTLWAVRLRPGKAHLSMDDYLYSWRNLPLDIANGVLSYRWVKAYEEHRIRPTLDTLLLWAQGKRVVPNTKSVAVDLGLIHVLPQVEEKKLPMLITLLANYLAEVFDDHRSRRFYAGLLWAVVRGELPAPYLFALLVRVMRDYMEGLITRPGAFIVKSLKQFQVQGEQVA